MQEPPVKIKHSDSSQNLSAPKHLARVASRSQARLQRRIRSSTRCIAKSSQENTTFGLIEVFPRIPRRPPRLLDHLHNVLIDATRMSKRMTAINKLLPRDSNTSRNLSLDAHREVLEEFIQSFGTYRDFLLDIKEHMDRSLNDGLRCAYENIDLRKQLAEMEENTLTEIEAAKIDEHLDTCEAQELSAKLNETLAEARKTDLRKRSAIQDLKIARKDLMTTLQNLEVVRKQHESLVRIVETDTDWMLTPLGKELGGLCVGSITKQEELEMDSDPFETTTADSPPGRKELGS